MVTFIPHPDARLRRRLVGPLCGVLVAAGSQAVYEPDDLDAPSVRAAIVETRLEVSSTAADGIVDLNRVGDQVFYVSAIPKSAQRR